MAQLSLYNAQGERSGVFTFGDAFLPEVPHTHLMHLHVVRQLRHARAGTASTLTRSEVSGGGKKPWKQKGTGRARAGSIRSPLWKGGGVIFGPKPRAFSLNLPVKARRLAIRSAILEKVSDMLALEDFQFERPSTKSLSQLLYGRLGLTGRVLLIVKEHEDVLRLSARNLATVKLVLASNLGVRDLLSCEHVVATQDALRHIEEVFKA